MPHISVIVPVYKVELYLKRCVDSILAQTFTDFELILVDDGSPDNSPAICDEYAQMDSRIHVIHQNNGGLSAARNAGIDRALKNIDSKWITFIDSDDWVHPQYLELLFSAATINDVNLSICKYIETTEYNDTFEHFNNDNSVVYKSEDYYVKERVNATIACGKLYNKNCFSQIRFPVGKIHEDEFTTYKILFSLENFAVLDIPLYYYYQNSNGITKSEWTPQRLHAFEAFDEQLNYFVANEYKRAEINVAIDYIFSITKHLTEIRNSTLNSSEKKRTQRKLLRKIKANLFKYRRLFPFEQSKYLYEIAYPKFMYLYWILYTLKKKFFNME